MCFEVISVSPAASVGEVAGVLLRHGISAVPVIGDTVSSQAF